MDTVIIKEYILENHMDRCRCCLKKLDVDSQTEQVTKLIENLFFDLTRIQLKNSEKYSNLICITCKKDLIYFSDLKRILTTKQLKIYEFVEERDEILNNELKEEHHQQLLDSHLDFELIDEENIKTEHNNEKSESTMIVDTFQWFELKNSDKSETFQTPFNVHNSTQFVPRSKTACIRKRYKNNTEQYCEICKIFLSNKNKYNMHQDRIHLKIKNNFCDKCGFSACSKGEILSHMKGKHFPKELKKFPCNLCNKILSSSSCLRIHILTHDKKSNHHCEVCGLGFQRNVNVQRHIKRVHEKVTNFKCNEPGCDKAYYSKKELQTHNAAVHKKVSCEIKCKFCDKLYNSELSFSRHLKSHFDQPWSCDLCSEKFFKKGLLTDHKRSKHWDNH